jgi:hypothetical protein
LLNKTQTKKEKCKIEREIARRSKWKH